MAEAAALVWLRSPSFGCKAVWCASAPRSIEKTTNREACRDLSGRRLRDVNHEKAMAEWVKQQAEREAEKEQKRLERLQRKLAEPRHCFTSPDYQQQCHEMAERLEDSVLREVELLGLEKLKCELTARGLKCGGTLQERAARLFSVRGLAKERIDPALFAKPSKGKKK
ncbi:hypothetical protein J1605_021074 [Eschrichtius robustus]|uniref:Replication stress response regulator SDE2 n=1 Tax=Eschrichtius robustus TaxID=9764 RepID=A0AB34HJK7_ESCRO|nr:hypothetical protein J1605_021074 [Eschrichtius robustus]